MHGECVPPQHRFCQCTSDKHLLLTPLSPSSSSLSSLQPRVRALWSFREMTQTRPSGWRRCRMRVSYTRRKYSLCGGTCVCERESVRERERNVSERGRAFKLNQKKFFSRSLTSSLLPQVQSPAHHFTRLHLHPPRLL